MLGRRRFFAEGSSVFTLSTDGLSHDRSRQASEAPPPPPPPPPPLSCWCGGVKVGGGRGPAQVSRGLSGKKAGMAVGVCVGKAWHGSQVPLPWQPWQPGGRCLQQGTCVPAAKTWPPMPGRGSLLRAGELSYTMSHKQEVPVLLPSCCPVPVTPRRGAPVSPAVRSAYDARGARVRRRTHPFMCEMRLCP